MDKVFVIMELGYEYNDSYYYRPECGGGDPVKYYTDRAAAQKACTELNAKAQKSVDPEDYSYGEEVDVEDLEFYEVVEVPLG